MQNIVTIILFLTSVRRDTDFVFCKSFIVNQSFSKAVALMRLTPRIAFQNRKVGLVKSYRCVAKRRQIKKHSCSTKRVLQFPLPTAVRFVVEILLRCLNLNRRKRHYKQNRFSAKFVLSGKSHLLVVSCILCTPIYFVARLFVTTM